MTALNPGAEPSGGRPFVPPAPPLLCAGWTRPAGLASASPFPLPSEVPSEEACPLRPARNNPAAPRRSWVPGRPRPETQAARPLQTPPLPSPVLGAAQQGPGWGRGCTDGRDPELPIVPGSRDLGPAALPLSLGQPEADWHQAGG